MTTLTRKDLELASEALRAMGNKMHTLATLPSGGNREHAAESQRALIQSYDLEKLAEKFRRAAADLC